MNSRRLLILWERLLFRLWALLMQKSMDAKAGMDMDSIQTKYLWAAGLKMVAMALLMAVTSVCVGFLASRVGAGVARDMREKAVF